MGGRGASSKILKNNLLQVLFIKRILVISISKKNN